MTTEGSLFELTPPSGYFCTLDYPALKLSLSADWMLSQLKRLTTIFPITLAAYSFHETSCEFVLMVDTRSTEQWDEMDIANRWSKLHYDQVKEWHAWSDTDPRKYSCIAFWHEQLIRPNGFINALKSILTRLSQMDMPTVTHTMEPLMDFPSIYNKMRLCDRRDAIHHPWSAGNQKLTSLVQRLKDHDKNQCCSWLYPFKNNPVQPSFSITFSEYYQAFLQPVPDLLNSKKIDIMSIKNRLQNLGETLYKWYQQCLSILFLWPKTALFQRRRGLFSSSPRHAIRHSKRQPSRQRNMKVD